MELKIYSPTEGGFIQSIDWNYEELKTFIAEKISYYKDLVYTDDQIKDAKADRAKLNKLVQALENQRKDIKKQCLAPYEVFEKQIKEIVSMVNEPILMIDTQVKADEERKKAEKLEKIQEYWQSVLQADRVPEGITFDQLFNEKWLNASVNLKTVFAELDAKLEQIDRDLATLENLPEFGFEAKEVYKHTLDINKAIAEGHRLSEIQKRKAEAEAARKAAEAARVAEINNAPEVSDQIPEAAPVRMWVNFAAYLSTEDAAALKQFFNSRNIKYKAI